MVNPPSNQIATVQSAHRNAWTSIFLGVLAVSMSACGGSTQQFTASIGQALPTIAAQKLRSALAGVPYNASLTARGGTPPYSWTISSGSLPPGFVLAGRNGSIEGITEKTGGYVFQATSTDSRGEAADWTYDLTVGGPLPLTITAHLPSATIGTAYSASPAAHGGIAPYSWTIVSGGLPPGLDLAPGSGIVSGVVGIAGSFGFELRVTDSMGATATALTSISTFSPNGATFDDIYCNHGTPAWGETDGPASLPTACIDTSTANTPATGSNVVVSAGGDLQAALNGAICGQHIILTAGASYTGNFTLPTVSCPSNQWVWIQSSGLASLPAEGARYSTQYNSTNVYLPQFGPCYAGVSSLPGRPTLACPTTPGTYTAQIITPNTSPVFTFTAGTSGVRFIGVEFTRATGTGYIADLISLGNVGNVDHVIFDRIWCHGDEQQDETDSCFSDSATSYVASVDSYYDNFYCISVSGQCTDSHPIFGGVNTTNSTTETGIKYVNNFLEGAGENMLHGGGSCLSTPSNFEIRLNLFFKPLTWNPNDPSYNGGVDGNPYIVKNLFEFKNAQLALVEGNQFINNWSGFSQGGEAWAITPVNQSGGCPTATDANLTIRYNQINSVDFGIELDLANNGGFLGAAENHYSLHDNVMDNMGYCQPNCPTSNPTIQMTTNYGITLATQAQQDVSVNHNTFVYAPSSTASAAIGLSSPTITSGLNQYNETFTNNVMLSFAGTTNLVGGSQPLNCANGQTSGTNMINACWANYTFGGNCFVNNGSHMWPGTNVTSVASFPALFTNYNNGDNGNYLIVSGSPCKNSATDGTDPGADIATVNGVLAGGAIRWQAP